MASSIWSSGSPDSNRSTTSLNSGPRSSPISRPIRRAHRATDDAEAALRVLYALAQDPRLPSTYAALVREQTRLGRAQDEARRFWRK